MKTIESNETEYVVMYRNQFPVQVHRNVGGRVFSLVEISEASRFDSPREAREEAIKAGVAPENIQVKPVAKEVGCGK